MDRWLQSLLKGGYDPNQTRDEKGRWSPGGGGGASDTHTQDGGGANASPSPPPDGGEKPDLTRTPPGGHLNQRDVVDVHDLYEHAVGAEPEIISLTHALARDYNGRAVFAPAKSSYVHEGRQTTLKGRDSAIDKADGEFKGDYSRLTDIARSTVIFDNFEDLHAAVTAFSKEPGVLKISDRFANPTMGYRDILVNYRFSNGHIGEIQFGIKAIMDVKYGEGHTIYEQSREIIRKANKIGQPISEADNTLLKQLSARSTSLYDAAYASSMKRAA